MVNVAAVAYARYKSLSVTPDETPQFAASQTGLLNTPAGQASFFPAIAFSGGVDNPIERRRLRLRTRRSAILTAPLTISQWQFGKHNFTFGGQVVWDQFNYIKNLTNSSPLTYTFANTSTQQWS